VIVQNEIDWLVVFVDSGRFNMWDIFTSKGYRHCFAIRWDGYNWVMIDPMGSWLEVQVLPYGPEDNVAEMMRDRGYRVGYVRKSRRDRFIFRGFMTCVSTVKHLLGIRAAWVITPKQLHNYIIRKQYGIFTTKTAGEIRNRDCSHRTQRPFFTETTT